MGHLSGSLQGLGPRGGGSLSGSLVGHLGVTHKWVTCVCIETTGGLCYGIFVESFPWPFGLKPV